MYNKNGKYLFFFSCKLTMKTIVCTIFFIYSHCYIELIVQRVKPLQVSAWACTAEQFETASLFQLALCILVFKVRLSYTYSVWAVFFGREGALNPIPDIRKLWLLSDTASPNSSPMCLILWVFSSFVNPAGLVFDRSWGLWQLMYNPYPSYACHCSWMLGSASTEILNMTAILREGGLKVQSTFLD